MATSTLLVLLFLPTGLNVKEPTLRASVTLTPARATGTTNPDLSAAQAGVGTNPCLVSICNQRGALRATIRAS